MATANMDCIQLFDEMLSFSQKTLQRRSEEYNERDRLLSQRLILVGQLQP